MDERALTNIRAAGRHEQWRQHCQHHYQRGREHRHGHCESTPHPGDCHGRASAHICSSSRLLPAAASSPKPPMGLEVLFRPSQAARNPLLREPQAQAMVLQDRRRRRLSREVYWEQAWLLLQCYRPNRHSWLCQPLSMGYCRYNLLSTCRPGRFTRLLRSSPRSTWGYLAASRFPQECCRRQ